MSQEIKISFCDGFLFGFGKDYARIGDVKYIAAYDVVVDVFRFNIPQVIDFFFQKIFKPYSRAHRQLLFGKMGFKFFISCRYIDVEYLPYTVKILSAYPLIIRMTVHDVVSLFDLIIVVDLVFLGQF